MDYTHQYVVDCDWDSIDVVAVDPQIRQREQVNLVHPDCVSGRIDHNNDNCEALMLRTVRRLVVVLIGTGAAVVGAATTAQAIAPHILANHTEPLIRR